jgi:hypothetical protein
MFLFWRLLKRTAKNACLAAKMDAEFSNQSDGAKHLPDESDRTK